MSKKSRLHPRNRHKTGYDFARLVTQSPHLKRFTKTGLSGQTTIDFSDDKAVRTLNQALLKTYYNVGFWEIPDTYLCPPIPGRVDYVHYLADLLSRDNNQEIPRGHQIKVLDIGTGANLVYPLTGQNEYGWHFTGSDIDPVSIKSAQKICTLNKLKIDLKLQKHRENIFKGIIAAKDRFHLTMCNPPFHSSASAAKKGTQRKWKNLGKGRSNKLNFGGQNAELWCPGGELKFISRMIEESRNFADQCLWFSCLVSKKDNLNPLQKILEKNKVVDVQVIEMAQGQKISRFIAWSYMKQNKRRSEF